MTNATKRRLALTLALAGLSTIAAAGALLRDELVERWYIFRLDADNLGVRLQAAQELGRMRSARAAPRLVELLAESESLAAASGDDSRSAAQVGQLLARALEGIGTPAALALGRALEESRGERRYWRRIACKSLGAIGGQEALAPLQRLLSDDWACVRASASEGLASTGTHSEETLAALSVAIEREQVSAIRSLLLRCRERMHDGQ